MGPYWSAKIDQTRIPNQSKLKTVFKSEQVARQEPLGAILGRSWGISEAILGSKFALRYSRALVTIHVFDVDQLSRRVLDRTWPILAAKSAKNDPMMVSQNDPKSTQNRRQKSIEILIDNKTNFTIHLGRSGGMRWPPGGIIGGSKNYIFEICRCLRRIMALRFGDLVCGLGIRV